MSGPLKEYWLGGRTTIEKGSFDREDIGDGMYLLWGYGCYSSLSPVVIAQN